ncbi:MAG: hypothetical protein VCC00_08975 [Deltaproteobacteria bacterium]
MSSSPEPAAGVELPANTGWPLLAALGLVLGFTGLVTHVAVTGTGVVLFAIAMTGWFRLVLPREDEEYVIFVPASERADAVVVTVAAERLEIGRDLHRMRLPLERHPYSAGVRGGLVGGVAMAATAEIYGLLAHGSLWYVVNLLAASALASLSAMSPAELAQFSTIGLAVGLLIHLILSVFMGLLYGVLLPMFPYHPILWGGVVAPTLWTSLVYTGLRVVDPGLEARLDWPFFIASQIAFGLVAGFVVDRTEKIATLQSVSIYHRAGVEAPGVSEEKGRPE